MFGRNGGTGFGGGGRAVCKFFLEGRCKFGDQCKNEHPRNATQPNNFNRFAPLQNPTAASRGRANAFGGSDQEPVLSSAFPCNTNIVRFPTDSVNHSPARMAFHGASSKANRRPGHDNSKTEPFGITNIGIQKDLTTGGNDGERPIWPFSAYAPGINPPRQLIEGSMEQSPEEMRVQYYLAQAAGKPQEYVQKEQTMVSQMDQQIKSILNDLDGARKYVVDGQYQHPNRHDMVIKPDRDFPRSTPPTSVGGFGQASSFGGGNNAPASSNSAFGQASALGSKPAFGAPSAMGGGASSFGQSSSLGSSSTGSAFGKPSGLGGGSAFGQASSLGQRPGFGGAQKPTPFGQTAQPAASGGASPFGSVPQQQQPAFGQTSQPSAFAQASKPTGFGQTSQPSAFGQSSALGRASQPSPFSSTSQPSGFGQASQTSAFGQATAPSPFTSAQPANSSGFGQTSTFGASANNPSPFTTATQPQPQQPATNVFGQPSQPNGLGSTTKPANPFASAPTLSQPGSTTNSGFGQSGFGQIAPPTANAATTGQSPWQNKRTVQDDKGNPCYVTSAPGGGEKLVRIWFPSGPPAQPNPLAEAPPEKYTGELGSRVKEIYDRVRETGSFGDGVMPEVPPKREWVSFDF